MLISGFLGKVTDFAAEIIFKDDNVRDKVAAAFGLHEYLQKTDELEKILGLFSEWIVFDYAQDLFSGQTALGYFVRYNPFELSTDVLSAYRDILNFEVGLFAVGKIERGGGIFLTSLATGKKQFVHDINASMTLQKDDTVWTRIASIAGVYYCVGSTCLSMPVRMMGSMRNAIARWEVNSLDARAVLPFLGYPNAHGNRESQSSFSKKGDCSLRQAELDFINALRKCGMDSFFTIATCKEWIMNEKKYKPNFAHKAVFGLIPDDASETVIR